MTHMDPAAARSAGWVVRAAEPDDVAAVDALIRQLATTQGHPDAVTAQPSDLAAALFGDSPTTHCLVCLDGGGRVVAIALWFVIYSTWVGRHGIWLEDLVVDQTARGRGVGQLLMRRLAQECLQRGYARLDWTVLTHNDGGRRFYDRLGAHLLEDARIHRLDADGLVRLAAADGSTVVTD